MPLTGVEIIGAVHAVIWPFLRISALLLAAPVFGSRIMPLRIRIALGLALAAMVAQMLPNPPAIDPFTAAGLVTAVREIALGVAMGFTLELVFSAFSQAGETMALSMGLGFAQLVDPQNGLRVPLISQYYVILTTLLFLAMNGHLMAFEVLVTSFRTIPVGGVGLSHDAMWQIVIWGSRMFEGAVLIALPVVASQLLVYLALGMITRAAPQLNIFAVGFPMLILAGILMMLFTLPSVPELFREILGSGFDLMQRISGSS